MNFLLTDLRHAWRVARRSPGVTLAMIIMLALGTGGVTTVFNPIYRLISTPLPFPQPEQLVIIGGNIPIFNYLYGKFEHREATDGIFSNLSVYSPDLAASIYMPETGKYKYNVRGLVVTEEFFDTLRVRPIRGSAFRSDIEGGGVVISHRFWLNEFNLAEDVIGKVIQQGRVLYTVVGIMPEKFDFPGGVDFWFRMVDGGSFISIDETRILGRLQPGMSSKVAAIQLRMISLTWRSGLHLRSDGPILQPLKTTLYGDRASLLSALGAVAVLFLLLLCTGVMNLLITQGAGRRSEMALRLVMGATRRNLICMLLRETLPLVVAGSLVGLWFSKIANTWLLAQFPTLMEKDAVVPEYIPLKIAYFLALVVAVTFIGGLKPALYITRVDLNKYLTSGATFMRSFFSLRELLAGAQLALALALMIGVGLLLRNMMFNFNIPIGWSPNEIAVVIAQLPTKPASEENREELWRRLATFSVEFRHHLNTIPGVVSAGVLFPIPFSPEAELVGQNLIKIAYKRLPIEMSAYAVGDTALVSPEGFSVLGVPLISGRFFTDADAQNHLENQILFAEKQTYRDIGTLAIINHSLARQFWPGENAVGKTLYGRHGAPHEVVGVVQDIYMGGNKKIYPTVFLPDIGVNDFLRFLVRLHSESLVKDLRQRLSAYDAGSIRIEVQSLGDYTSDPLTKINLALQFIGSFAFIGLVVAGLGVYATTTLMAASRNKEIGVRMAMGAQTTDILRFALWRGMRPILIGLPVGLLLATILSKFLSSFIVQLNITDPLVWLLCCTVLVGIAAIASLIPALRAIQINPLDVLRKD